MRIAILSPSNNSYTETFINSHRNLKGDIFFFFEGEIPKRVEGYRQIFFVFDLALKLFFKAIKVFSKSEYGYDLFLLKRNLLRHKIDIGLAEYGTTGASCCQVFKSLKIPLVVHFHGYDASMISIVHRYKDKYLELFKYSHTILVVSNEMYSSLVKQGADKNKLILNYYGPSEIFSSVKNKVDDSIIFLTVGRFTEKKSPMSTIKAFAICVKKVSDLQLWMVGKGELLDECKALVMNLGLERNIFFTGSKKPEEIAKMFESAYAFLLHSVTSKSGDKEGTPVSILEAMSAGLPVVSTLHGGIGDVVIDGRTGFLNPEHDVEAMASSMMKLIDNRSLRDRFSDHGRKRIEEKFTRKRYLDTIDEVLAKAID